MVVSPGHILSIRITPEFVNLPGCCVHFHHLLILSIALGYRLDDWGSKVQFPEGAGNFSLHYHVQNGSGAHPASYPMVTRGSFPGDKAAGA